MTRSADLLLAAAKALDGGDDPFSREWLADNEVTFEEAAALTNQLALGGRILVLLSTIDYLKPIRAQLLSLVVSRYILDVDAIVAEAFNESETP